MGDSGGPLIVQSAAGPRLEGAVSFGSPCARGKFIGI
jgi:secreted trypsin-like serine protease